MKLKLKINRLWLRRAAFVLIIIITASLQNTKGAVFSPSGIHAMLLIPLVVSIAVYEKSIVSLFIGAFAGIMWDMVSVSVDGFFSVFLAVTAFACSLLITFEMRNNIYSVLLLTAAASFVCSILYWIFFILIKNYDMSIYVYFRYYFTSFVYTVLYTFIYYYLVKWISKKTETEKKRINY